MDNSNFSQKIISHGTYFVYRIIFAILLILISLDSYIAQSNRVRIALMIDLRY